MCAAPQVFLDALSLAEAARRAAYACGPNAEWNLLQSLTAEVQSALDAASDQKAVATGSEQEEEEWAGWDDGAEASSKVGMTSQGGAESVVASVRRNLEQASHISSASIKSAGSDIHFYYSSHTGHMKTLHRLNHIMVC